MKKWQPVVGFEGLYEVSSEGEVRAVRRFGSSGNVLKVAAVNNAGHRYVDLYRDAARSHRTIHSLVAEAFIGPRPEGLHVRHLDGVPTNNAVQNLAYGTCAENMRDTVRHGKHGGLNKTHCPNGHPYNEANTYVPPNRVARECRTCRAERSAKRSAKLSA